MTFPLCCCESRWLNFVLMKGTLLIYLVNWIASVLVKVSLYNSDLNWRREEIRSDVSINGIAIWSFARVMDSLKDSLTPREVIPKWRPRKEVTYKRVLVFIKKKKRYREKRTSNFARLRKLTLTPDLCAVHPSFIWRLLSLGSLVGSA